MLRIVSERPLLEKEGKIATVLSSEKEGKIAAVFYSEKEGKIATVLSIEKEENIIATVLSKSTTTINYVKLLVELESLRNSRAFLRI